MTPVAGALRTEFKVRSEAAALLRERHLHALREEQVRRERREDQRDVGEQEFLDLAVTLLAASEIATFRAELDLYETASVIALQENERALEAAQRRVDEILLRAHVLPDGRRVFKTEDGKRVFDEFGVEVEASVIPPESIADERPRYEAYQTVRNERARLERERSKILKYQQRLDDARERLNSGEMTREEYDHLRDDLKTSMPDAVRRHVPGMTEAKGPTPNAAPTSASDLTASDFAADMVPKAAAPSMS